MSLTENFDRRNASLNPAQGVSDHPAAQEISDLTLLEKMLDAVIARPPQDDEALGNARFVLECALSHPSVTASVIEKAARVSEIVCRVRLQVRADMRKRAVA